MNADTPAFDAPWQAEAFALVVALNESGHLPWSDWAAAFARQLAADTDGGAPDSPVLFCGPGDAGDRGRNARYWRAWTLALESICRERGWAGPLQLGAHREAVRAYRRRVSGNSPLVSSTARPGAGADQSGDT